MMLFSVLLAITAVSATASGAAAAAPLPLPLTATAAAQQASVSARRALAAGHKRLAVHVLGDGLDSPGPLPLSALCTHLTRDLSAGGRVVHLFFDSAPAAHAWRALGAVGTARCSVLGEGGMEQDDGVLVVVSPCNRGAVLEDGREAEADAPKLLAVQSLVCGAQHRPVILANPDLEALLVTTRVGRAVRPMFLSDFEDAFYLVSAVARRGHVTAVRRRFGEHWEVYSVEEQALAAAAAPPGTPPPPPQQREDELEDEQTATLSQLEFRALSRTSAHRPKAADALTRHVRRRQRAGRRDDLPRPGEAPPGSDEPFAAEDGWGMA